MPHTLLAAALLGACLAAAPLAARAEPAQAPPPETGAPQAQAAPADLTAARAPVEALYDALLDVMKRAAALGFQGRYQVLEPAVAASYDVPFMSELILGQAWRTLTPEQQATWRDTFQRLTVSTYADRFDGFSGERFVVGDAGAASQGTALVHTQLLRKDGDPVKLDYRLRETAGGWRIIDVYLSGTVSELALRRSEYAALIKREGFDALLTAVRGKIAAAETGTSNDATTR